ncbi:oxidoreductase/nitrogenase component 1 [Syntrophobotulus glycolicus DSM 8271]|uniref:Oxidoreductase/nitrogenase component 1 n=1 Tax=Syntrophobotulus glycolicus (strain DSM 8271 / FlGlyR) TaxID=645991 RepID=F0SXY2_SYNGF|nr:nitrogenase component 1 [Syntrophobotulus glycolicus]ADY57043.1 oxidoreductase/nitrogenase component 1 [Syntrophobotulus glycolicus DSM 8271]
MGLIDQKVVPKREDRLNASNAYGGKISDLIKESGSGCLINKNRSFCQTFNCQLGLALSMVTTIPDAVLIMHGPIGCGNQQNDNHFRIGQIARGIKPKPLLWVSTNLDENDIINGGEKKLEEAILEVDSFYRPAAIIVLTTCAPGIIGDDVDELVARVQKNVAARVMLTHCEGFKTKISATGYDAVYHGIARSFDLEDEEETNVVADELDLLREQYEKSRTVNIYNTFSIGRTDELELQRLLNSLDLRVNFYPNFVHPEAFKELAKAALNVSLCPTHDDYFLKHLQERFGIPYIIRNMPIGIKNTNEWLLDIAREFHLEAQAQRIIESETAALQKGLLPFAGRLKGKKVFVSGGEIRVAVTGMLLKELGCELVGIRGHHYDHFGDDIFSQLIADNPDLNVNIATTQIFELVNLLNKSKPDLLLGHSGSNVWAAKLGIPSIPIFAQAQYYFGYRGVFEVARRAVRALGNTAFQSSLKENVNLPFKKEWYTKNPFSYIVE